MNFNTLKYFTCLLVSLLLVFNTSKASHIVGLELYYTHVAGNTYKITLVAYGDCGPASSGAFATLSTASPAICIYNGATSVSSISLTVQAPSTGVEITPVCHADSLLTQCTNPAYSIPGIKKFVYSGNYTVSGPSSVWRFIFTGNLGGGSGSAGRAAAITNIGPGTTSQLVDTLNNTVYANSNPLMTTVPVPFFCLNNNDSYTPGAVDPDGDSLSFFLISGMNGSGGCSSIGGSVSYTGGYSGPAPLGVAPGTFSFDQHTGQISFNPNILQRALVVYNVEEFRGGSFVGSCQREMTFLVLTCTSLPPTGVITGSTSTGGTVVDSTHFRICQNSGAFSININPVEADTSNTITVSATGLPTGSTFTTVNNGTNHPTCTFSWTSTGVTPGTYIFYVTLRDNACPISGTQTRAFTVIILPSPVIHATGGATVCLGTAATLVGTGGVSYTWLPGTGLSCVSCTVTSATPSATTIYTVTGTDANGCTNSDTVSVRVNPLPVILAGPDTTICTGSSAVLTGSGGISYTWSPGTGLSCTTCTSVTATPAGTTTYTVTGRDANGCTNTDLATVTINPLPTIGAGPNVAICIGTSTSLTATGGTTYTWTPSTGLSCTACTTTTASPTVTTTYTISGTSAAGCSNTGTVTVSVNPLPVISAGPAAAICAGAIVTFTGYGGTSYIWLPSTGLSCSTCTSTSASPTVTTTYTVTGTNGTGCSNTATVTITVNPLPVVSASPSVSVCTGFSTSLSASGASTYLWTPSSGLSCSTCSSTTAGPTTTTTYTVTGTSAAGCSNTATVTVSVNPIPTIGAGPGVTICVGNSASLTATGGASYTWTPGASLSCSNCTTTTASPTVTTTYTISGTSAAGCVGTGTITVSVNPLPVITTSPGSAVCLGSSATISASGATSYSWLPTTGVACPTCASTSVTPTTTSTYTVTGINGSGCSNTATVTITVNPLPTITAGPPSSLCPGGSVTLTAAGGVSYAWAPATGLSCTTCTSTVASPTTTTTYTITGTNSNGCISIGTVTVTINPLPTIHGGPAATICIGFTTTLTGTGGVSYTWAPGSSLSCTACTSTVASPTVTTVYTVTGTDANGCINKDTVWISTYTAPPIDGGPNVAVCIGSSTTLTGTGGVTYVWSPGVGLSCSTCTSPVATPGTTTIFTVTGTDAFGCHNTDTVRVTVRPLPVVDGGPHHTACLGVGTTLTPSGGVSYTWSPGTGLSCTSCTNPVATPGGTTIYTVTGTDVNGCRNIDTVSISVNPLPVISAGAPTDICIGGSTTLAPSGGISYVWTTGAGLSCTSCTSPVATPTVTTLYTVRGTDANGCQNTASVTITVHSLPAVDAGPNRSICVGSSIMLIPSGGIAYVWGPGTGLSCTICANPFASPSVTTTYTVSGTDAWGCQNTDTIRITVNPLPIIDAGPHRGICLNTTTVLNPTGGVSYVWSPGTGLSCVPCTSPTAGPISSIIYTVTGTDVNGCVNSDTVSITVLPLPFIDAGPHVSFCLGDNTTLIPSGGMTYVWTITPGLSCYSCMSPVATPSVTTVYTVTGTGVNGCTNKDTVSITVNPLPSISAGPIVNICVGNSTILNATGGVVYNWYPGTGLSCTACSSPTATPGVTTVYSVSGTSAAGCINSDTTTVFVNPLPVIGLSNSISKCIGDPYNIICTGGATYTWSPTTGLSCATCGSTVATPAATTTYSVLATTAFGCTGTSSLTVTINPLPVLTVSPTPVSICEGRDTLITVTGAINYFWSPSAGLSATTGSSVMAGPSNTTVYTIVGYDANNCHASINEPITIGALSPAPVVVSPVKYCINAVSLPLTAIGSNLIWYTVPFAGTGTTIDPIPSTSVPGSFMYYVSQTSSGCESPRDSIEVDVLDSVRISFDIDVHVGCLNDSVLFNNTSTGGTQYLWTFNDGKTDTSKSTYHLFHPVLDSAIYWVQLNGVNNVCSPDSSVKTFTLYPAPPIRFLHDLTHNQAIQYGKSIQLSVYGAWIYYWTPNNGSLDNNNINNPVATPTEKTTFTVYGYDHTGCEDSGQVTIDVITTHEAIPSAFTPNGDGKNDIFHVINLAYGKLLEMHVYNRWGELVCKTTDNDKGWDGTLDGVPQDIGVYNYYIIVERENHEQVFYKGDVTLIR